MEMGGIYGMRRYPMNEVGAGGGGPSFGGIVPVLGATVPMVKGAAANAGREALRRAFMQRQMEDAQAISDAVPRQPPAFQWAPPASQLLPEWPVTAPWPGSPRNTRVA